MASRSLGTLTLDLIARIGGFQQNMDRASQSVSRTGASADAASARVAALGSEFLSLSGVVSKLAGPLAAAFSVHTVYAATEAYSTLTNRLKLVTNGTDELIKSQAAVFGIAQDARQPLTATAELYQRIATNQKELKLSGEGVAGIVGTISKTLAISGSSADSANAALVQLGQAFASGVLRGEELNSVLEQAPALAQAIAAGMGKTVGDLRNLGEQGKLTAEAVVKALQNQAGAVDSLFSKMTATIGGSLTVVGNSVTRYIGEIDQMSGASGKVAGEILSASKIIDGSLPAALAGIREHSDALSQVLSTGLYIALARVAGGFTQQGAQALYAANANQSALAASAALAKQDLWSAQAKQIDAKATLQRANLELSAAQGKVASDRVRQASEVANIQSVQSALAAELALEQERLKAQINEQGRAATVARISEIRLAQVAVIKQVEAAERSLANTTVASSALIDRAYAGRAAATLALGETTAAVNALSVASNNAAAAASITGRALSTLAGAGRGALALLGGPAGLVFVAAAAALSFMDFRSSADKAAEGLEGLKGPLDQIIEKFKTLSQDQKAAALVKWGEAQAESVKAVDQAYSNLIGSLQSTVIPMSQTGYQQYDQLKEKLDKARAAGESLTPVLEEAGKAAGVKPEIVNLWKKQAGAVADTAKVQRDAEERISALNGVMAQGVTTTTASTQATAGLTTAGQKYLQTLQDQLGKLQDNNDAVKEATRYLGSHKELSEADRVSIMSTANALKAQADANKTATKETKENTSAIRANQKTFDDAEENYKRQIELINTTTDKQKNATEVEKLGFEISSGKYADLNEQRKKLLGGLAAELDAKKALLKADEEAKKLKAFSSNVDESNQSAKDGFDQELAGAGEGEKRKARLKEMLAIEQDFNKQQRELVLQRNSDDISQELYDKETAKLSEALAGRLVIQQDHYNQLDDAQSNWMDGVSDAWQNYVDAAKNYTAQAAEAAASILDGATSGLSTFFTDVATGAETAGDALVNLVTDFAKTTIKALADMAAQWLVYQAVQLVVGKTAQITAYTGLVGTAQATSFQAQLAAYASTAAIPIFGPALAPAAALAAAAATAPMVAGVAGSALAGMAHDGMGNIPKEGTWLLDGGERVVAPAQNRDLTSYLARQKSATDSIDASAGKNASAAPVVNVIEDASKAGQSRSRQMDGRWVIDQFVSDIRGDGKGAKAIQQMFGMGRAAR